MSLYKQLTLPVWLYKKSSAMMGVCSVYMRDGKGMEDDH